MHRKSTLPLRGLAALMFMTAVVPTTRAVSAAGRPSEAAVPVRGPIHEAFAQPLSGAETPGTVFDGRPPPPLAHTPPATKPGIAAAAWIPGYWGWEPAMGDLVWVPGVWRVPPPGMRWVPGYWSVADQGWRWVRGFWFPRNQPRLQYLPPPPPPANEPPAPTPPGDRFAVPGYWSYEGEKYVWRRGFQAPFKAGWVWMPSHSVWTPRGSVFVPGYWDFAIERRGLALLPMAAGTQSNVSPKPALAINLADLSEALFVGAVYGHFYFGDYFDVLPGAADIKPWYEPDATGRPEPDFAYERWRHQPKNAHWAARLAERYQARREHAERRPTLARPNEAVPSAARLRPEILRQAAQAANGLRQLAVMREKFESTVDAAPAGGVATLYLPAAADSETQVRATEQPRASVTEESLPGISGRRVPGVGQRTLPGVSGRAVPGVEADLPDVAAPGVDRRQISPKR
ncbi:MAG TPA: hypothetical protein VNH11_12665 [Pirellulales bacterium]|nr:hypothetical protein [Pirellulales bacterium]